MPYGSRGLVHEDDGSAGAKIKIEAIQDTLIRGSEPVGQGEARRSAEFQNAVAKVCRAIVSAVASDQIEIVAGIGGRRTTRHPDAAARIRKCADRIRCRVEDRARNLGKSGSVISHDPSVVLIMVFMRCPRDIDNAVDESEPCPLVMVLRIERNLAT